MNVDCPVYRNGKCLRGYFSGEPTVAQCMTVCIYRKELVENSPPVVQIVVAPWGPSVWKTIHTASTFDVASVLKSMPCGICRTFLQGYVASNKPPTDATLFNWTVDLHNAVNEHLNKPKMSYEEARKLWLVTP